MAIFKRRTASGGTWKTLACGGYDPEQIEASRTTVLKLTDLTSVKGGLSMQADLVSVPLYGDQRKTISSRPQARELVLTFSSADSSGIEQNAIRDFFSTTRAIEYTDSERGLEETIWVQAIDDAFFEGSNSMQITCACQDDTRLTRTRQTLDAGKITADAEQRIGTHFTNELSKDGPAVCELTLSSPTGAAAGVSSSAVWRFQKLSPEGPDEGDLSWSWRFQPAATAASSPLELTVSSLDEALGETRILVTPEAGAVGRFWQVYPGEEMSAIVEITGNPLLEGSEELNYKLELVEITPRGSADKD